MSADVLSWMEGCALAHGYGLGDRVSELLEFVLRPTRLQGRSVSNAPQEGSRFIDEHTASGRRSPPAFVGPVEPGLNETGLVPGKGFGYGARIAQPGCEANPTCLRGSAQNAVAKRVQASRHPRNAKSESPDVSPTVD